MVKLPRPGPLTKYSDTTNMDKFLAKAFPMLAARGILNVLFSQSKTIYLTGSTGKSFISFEIFFGMDFSLFLGLDFTSVSRIPCQI